MTAETVIDDVIAGIRAASIPDDVFTDDIVLDATVPNWRYTVHGAGAVHAELAKWYAAAGDFEGLRRSRLPDGELVEFTLRWEEGGIPHMCHQAHVFEVRGGLVAKDTVWCGGRWPADLVAQMQATESSARALED